MMETALELEHVIGYTGRYMHSLVFHPSNKQYFIYPIGAVLVISDVKDPHNQSFLRGPHDNEITCVAVSATGRLIATAQLGTTKRKGSSATIVVWSMKTREPVFQIEGHINKVYSLSFTHDDRFLLSTGESGLNIWETDTGKSAGGLKLDKPALFVECAPQSNDFNSKRPDYSLVVATENQVRVCKWRYDVKQMQFVLTSEPIALPGRISGFNRVYYGACIDPTGEFCYAGTKTGELIVFSIKNAIFRTSEQVSSNGVISLCPFVDNQLFIGSGDGKLKRLRGYDQKWEIVQETQLQGKINSLSLSTDGSLLIAGTDHGKIYLVNTNDFKSTLLEESHINQVTCVSFDGDDSEHCCTVSHDGTLRVWDLSDYSTSISISCPSEATVCIYMGAFVLSGWKDGYIRCHNLKNNTLKWEINGHRGGITSIDCNDKFICSGGTDGAIRVWSATSQEMLVQFTDHTKSVSQVLIDIDAPAILHSCGMDKTVLTFDLKSNKRIAYHAMSGSTSLGFTSLCQRVDGENELITCGMDGKIMFWDIDYSEPVQIIQQLKVQQLCCSVSPSGKYLATGGGEGDETVRIWEIKSGKLLSSGVCHSSPVLSVCWSPDEKQLISTGSGDCAITVWNFYP
jgi:WD40 repeat protein